VCLNEGVTYSEVKNVNDLKSFLSTLDFDLFVVVGHPYLLRKPLLDMADGIGFHPSLLPARRGRAPLNWAIIDGLEYSGVSLFKLAEGADEGLIYSQERFLIGKEDTVEDLVEKVNKILLSNLENLICKWPNLGGTRQDEKKATYTPRRYPEDGEIGMNMTAEEAERLVRALNGPYPSAFIKLKNSQKLYIHKASTEDKITK
jgi:methionyl-tRNA formyltransferase